jgi:hypothetical protein
MMPSKFGWYVTVAIAACAASIAIAPRFACAIEINLLPNGRLSEGSGKYPAYWRERFEQFESAPDATELGWNRDSDPPELEVRNSSPSAAGFQELVRLRAPGWYRLSAEVKAGGIGESGAGAQIGVAQFSIFTVATLGAHGTAGWNRVEFYLRASPRTRETMVFCRLGARGSPSGGDARFRDFRLVRIDGVPPPDAPQYDLDTLAPVTAVDSLWSVAAAFVLLAAVALVGSRSLGRLAQKEWDKPT